MYCKLWFLTEIHLKLRYISRQNKSPGGTYFWAGTWRTGTPAVENAAPPRWQEPGVSPALMAFALDNKNSAARFQSRPGPPHRGGPVHFSLDGERSGGVPSTKGNAATVGGGGVCAWSGAFSALAGALAGSARGSSVEREGCPPRSGRISVTPAVCLGWID